MLGYDFWIQLVVVLIALFYGARNLNSRLTDP